VKKLQVRLTQTKKKLHKKKKKIPRDNQRRKLVLYHIGRGWGLGGGFGVRGGDNIWALCDRGLAGVLLLNLLVELIGD